MGQAFRAVPWLAGLVSAFQDRGDTMSMQEISNLVEILDAMGLKAQVGDLIMGIEGKLTPREVAKRLLEAMQDQE